MLRLRQYDGRDAAELWRLFHNTVRSIDKADYSAEQLAAWVPDDFDDAEWQARMDAAAPFMVEADGRLVGYADLQESGCIDQFYVHHEWQRKGIGALLMREIHRVAQQRELKLLFSNVSITARRFFETWAFSIERAKTVELRGVRMQNFRMQKRLPSSSGIAGNATRPRA